MREGFAIFDISVRRRGRTWAWCIWTQEGYVAMQGRAKTLRAAKYQASRVLFQLLLYAPYRHIRQELSKNGNGRPLKAG